MTAAVWSVERPRMRDRVDTWAHRHLEIVYTAIAVGLVFVLGAVVTPIAVMTNPIEHLPSAKALEHARTLEARQRSIGIVPTPVRELADRYDVYGSSSCTPGPILTSGLHTRGAIRAERLVVLEYCPARVQQFDAALRIS